MMLYDVLGPIPPADTHSLYPNLGSRASGVWKSRIFWGIR